MIPDSRKKTILTPLLAMASAGVVLSSCLINSFPPCGGGDPQQLLFAGAGSMSVLSIFSFLRRKKSKDLEEDARSSQSVPSRFVNGVDSTLPSVRKDWKKEVERLRREKHMLQEKARDYLRTREQERRERFEKSLLRADELMCKLFSRDIILIDNLVWRTQSYESFIRFLKYHLIGSGQEFILYRPQFDELCEVLRDPSLPGHLYRDVQTAIERIEGLQEAGILVMDPVHISPQEKSAETSLTITLLKHVAHQHQSVALVAADRELRIRARQVMRGKEQELTLMKIEDEIAIFEEALLARN